MSLAIKSKSSVTLKTASEKKARAKAKTPVITKEHQ
jgi:hypothetical protein